MISRWDRAHKAAEGGADGAVRPPDRQHDGRRVRLSIRTAGGIDRQANRAETRWRSFHRAGDASGALAKDRHVVEGSARCRCLRRAVDPSTACRSFGAPPMLRQAGDASACCRSFDTPAYPSTGCRCLFSAIEGSPACRSIDTLAILTTACRSFGTLPMLRHAADAYFALAIDRRAADPSTGRRSFSGNENAPVAGGASLPRGWIPYALGWKVRSSVAVPLGSTVTCWVWVPSSSCQASMV
jgi:hypothetical protein